MDGHELTLGGGDFLDGTPVLDLKPYLPYADAIPDARCDWAATAPEPLEVRLSSAAEQAIETHEHAASLRALVLESLRWDPRPAYRKDADTRRYGTRLMDVDVHWHIEDQTVVVEDVDAAGP
jgi:hypothetical protein